DILRSRSIKMCDIPEGTVKASEKRLSDIGGDPVMEYRKKAAEAAAKAAEEAAKNDPKRPPTPGDKAKGKPQGPPVAAPPEPAAAPPEEPAAALPDTTVTAPADSLMAPMDSLALAAPVDSLGVTAPEPEEEPEVVEEPKDTTKISFLWGSKRVRLFRKDMQMVSDSLSYTDLDSLVRLYQDPIFYNEGNKQYAADSIFLSIRNKTVEKANLLSNAFITIQEDPRSYDQIRGAEMVAYFDSTSALTRFDALGGAASIFYLVEQNALATVNKVESKMIYATFKDGDIERMYYYDNPKNDGYPTVQLPEDERQLKGFRWEPEKRPASPLDVTTLTPRKSQRTSYLARPHTRFTQTDIYFPGHIKKLYRDIALRDSLKVLRSREQQRIKDSIARAEADSTMLSALDSLAAPADSTAAADSIATAVTPPSDSTSVAPAKDTTAVSTQPQVPDKKALREAERKRREQEKAAKKAERQAAREAKWAEEDRRYEEKQAAKAAKKLEKERAKKLKALRRLEKKAQKERRQLEKYIQRERNKSHKK
ncbi:MAG: hypothetical protein J6Y66_02930, partial [Bacteroidales bacterium]|nr:hypothetical protein [Bacteroidales bacterium]